jgi:hypothetical protein
MTRIERLIEQSEAEMRLAAAAVSIEEKGRHIMRSERLLDEAWRPNEADASLPLRKRPVVLARTVARRLNRRDAMSDRHVEEPRPDDFREAAARSRDANIADETAGYVNASAQAEEAQGEDDSIEPSPIPGSAEDIPVARTGPGQGD